jgi:SAM-dependent methyltransferase
MTISDVAARGFGSAADVYERSRPGYAPEAVAWICERLGIAPGRTVLDLAAGTGKLTRALVPTAATVIAVEPLDEMRAQLEQQVEEARALEGTAEEIPLADGSVDAVVCAQAFHWFDPDRALPEIHRILRPGGGLAMLWNTRGIEEPVQARLDDFLLQHQEQASRDWLQADAALAASPLFGSVEHRCWPHEQSLSLDELIGLVASRSYIASLHEEPRSRLLAEVRQAFADEPEPIVLRYVVDVYVADRV